MKRIIPAPKSSENSPMNFWSMKISPKMPTAQSSQVSEPPRAHVQVWWQTELERYGVHQQNSEHGDAAYEVEAGYSRGFPYRA